MKYGSMLIFATMFLAACTTTPSPHEQTSGGHTPAKAGNMNLIVRDRSTDNEMAFSVRDGAEVFSDYGVSHTKEMHLIVVRDDLQNFQHLHPVRDNEDVWRVAFIPPAEGTYWRYADFVDRDESSYTIRFDRQYPGKSGTYGIAKNVETVKNFDGYQFSFHPVVSNNEVTFTYNITDNQGKSVRLEEYLGAKGHSVLISPSGDFIHTHPSDAADVPVFKTTLPPDPFYRIFTQLQIKGNVVTANFDWKK